MSENDALLTIHKYTLTPETELRIEVGPKDTVDIILESGDAECFGTELARETYTVGNCQLAIFTWHGCEITINGVVSHIYTGTETPYPTYVNLHTQLERLRAVAEKDTRQGPRVMVVGRGGTGKSTLIRSLLGWSVRHGWKPTHVDTDLLNNSIALPGCIAATPVEYPAGFLNLAGPGPQSPLAYFVGHETISKNTPLFHRALRSLNDALDIRHTQSDIKVRAAGCLIDTGAELAQDLDELVHVIRALNADIVVVVDDERLASLLTHKTRKDLPEIVTVTRVPRSGGAVTLPPDAAREARALKFKQYFYGQPGEGRLAPAAMSLPMKRVSLFSALNDAFVPSALPLGTGALTSRDRLLHVTIDNITINAIIAVTAATVSDDVGSAPVLGFLHVKDVDRHAEILQFLAPSSGPLPGHFRWMIGDIQWIDHS